MFNYMKHYMIFQKKIHEIFICKFLGFFRWVYMNDLFSHYESIKSVANCSVLRLKSTWWVYGLKELGLENQIKCNKPEI